MKTLLVVLLVTLSGCSLILPKPHDPVLFDNLVSVKIAVDKLTCESKDLNAWQSASDKIHHLTVYADIRKDPQADSLKQLQEAVGKARDSKSNVFCESILKINRTRIDVAADAWRGR
jgi:hypothetical protein